MMRIGLMHIGRRWVVVAVSMVVAAGLAAAVYGVYLYSRDGRKNLRDGHYRVAMAQYRPQAEAGDAQAQVVVGNLYLLGLGVARQPMTAARWYLRAALAGHIPAQINLGQLYASGWGVPRDTAKAVGWFYLAANAGSDLAGDYLTEFSRRAAATPNMLSTAQRNFSGLDLVRTRYGEMGEVDFLLK